MKLSTNAIILVITRTGLKSWNVSIFNEIGDVVRHNLYGPTKVFPDGRVEYWINQYKYSTYLEYKVAIEQFKNL